MITSLLASRRHNARLRSFATATVLILVAALGLVVESASAANADSTASISGTVVSSTSGTPIGNVAVGLDLPGGNYVQFGTTDENGNYSFTGLAAGSYVLNFAPAQDDNYVQQWSGNKPTLATATPIAVAVAQAVTGVNASLAEGATVTGNVQTASGPGAFDTAVIEDAAGTIYGSGFTDSSGNYSVSQLPAGSFTASFTSSFSAIAPSQWWDDKPSLATADFFTTTAGQSTEGIDATFPAGASGSVSGVVFDSSTPGAGLANANVQAFALDGSFAGTANTAADGSYTLSGLAPGSYTLEVLPGFFYPDLAPQYWQNESSFASADFFTISDGSALTGYDSHLAVGGTITGTVLDGAAGNVPLPNVGVSLYQNGTNVPVYAQTGADGNYTLSGLAAGSYDVQFQAQYPSSDASQWWPNATSEPGATEVSVSNGSTATGVNATMHAGGTITGVVSGKTANGTVFPAGNATLTVYASDGSVVSDYVMTDGDGGYTVTNLAPGSYKIDFVPQGDTTDFVPQWWKNKSTEATATAIVIKGGQTKSNISPVFASTTLKPAMPKISGTPKVGSTLTVKPGTWRPGNVQLTYQWSRSGVPVDGATSSTYALTNADANATITIGVTGTEAGYATDSVTSAPTHAITGGVLSTSVPVIHGSASVGKVITVTAGTWGPGAVNLTYKWYRGSARIGGATSASYTLVHADAGRTITSRVTGAEPGFVTATVASAPTGVIH